MCVLSSTRAPLILFQIGRVWNGGAATHAAEGCDGGQTACMSSHSLQSPIIWLHHHCRHYRMAPWKKKKKVPKEIAHMALLTVRHWLLHCSLGPALLGAGQRPSVSDWRTGTFLQPNPLITRTKPHCFIYAWRDWKWTKCFHSVRGRWSKASEASFFFFSGWRESRLSIRHNKYARGLLIPLVKRYREDVCSSSPYRTLLQQLNAAYCCFNFHSHLWLMEHPTRPLVNVKLLRLTALGDTSLCYCSTL